MKTILPFLSRDGSAAATEAADDRHTGILPLQTLKALIAQEEILPDPAYGIRTIADDQIQPASLDLRLGPTAYRLRASFLPGRGETVRDRMKNLVMHEIDLAKGAVLETGCVYLVPLIERLALSTRIGAYANPKSSTGRIDVFVRLITDGAREFDRVEMGYQGPLYAEISPRTFSILVRPGSRLNQIRFRRGTASFPDAELRRLQERERLVSVPSDEVDVDGGIATSVDLSGNVVGWRAKRHAAVIDVDARDRYEATDFFDPIDLKGRARLILDPHEFYILVSKEAIRIPPVFAAEMIPFDPLVGEFRVHYAGFFDPGFGHDEASGSGSRAVLEVRSRDVPFEIEDGQKVARLRYERMVSRPSELYGERIGSSYQRQGLKLSRHFRAE